MAIKCYLDYLPVPVFLNFFGRNHLFFKCLSESWPVVETGFKKLLPVVCYGSPSKIVVFHYRSSLPKTVLLYHMLLHQKPCFLVIAALYRKPYFYITSFLTENRAFLLSRLFTENRFTLFGSRLNHFSGSMCRFSGQPLEPLFGKHMCLFGVAA